MAKMMFGMAWLFAIYTIGHSIQVGLVYKMIFTLLPKINLILCHKAMENFIA